MEWQANNNYCQKSKMLQKKIGVSHDHNSAMESHGVRRL